MRPAARGAHYREAGDLERVDDLLDIGGRRCDVAATIRAGPAVTGPRVRDESDVARGGSGEERFEERPRLR
jgi:hypothetical protein